MLTVDKLRVHYTKVEAIRGVDIFVDQGEFVCLIGANGAGKTTMMRTISGLKKASSGRVQYKGCDIGRLDAEQVARLRLIQVPEGRCIFPHLTVTENLYVGGYTNRNKKQQQQRLKRVFDRFPRLRERARQAGGTLSGGEQQMLAFGRALMAGPEMLMLDEPTLGLAPLMVEECMRFAVDMNLEGLAILLVEQNARLALAISHRAYVLETGSIVLEGQSRALTQSDHVRKAYLGL